MESRVQIALSKEKEVFRMKLFKISHKKDRPSIRPSQQIEWTKFGCQANRVAQEIYLGF